MSAADDHRDVSDRTDNLRTPVYPPLVLTSWKDIAAFLGKGVRTVQRWERELRMPVHRPSTGENGVVIAYPKSWLAGLSTATVTPTSQGAATAQSTFKRRMPYCGPAGEERASGRRLGWRG